MYYGHSKELFQSGGSFEYPQHMFLEEKYLYVFFEINPFNQFFLI